MIKTFQYKTQDKDEEFPSRQRQAAAIDRTQKLQGIFKIVTLIFNNW